MIFIVAMLWEGSDLFDPEGLPELISVNLSVVPSNDGELLLKPGQPFGIPVQPA